MSQLEAMAFQEEPMVILIHRGQDMTSSKTTDLIAVNGVPAEMLFKNGWVEVGFLPKGIAITTKRKYVGVISSSKMESLMTRHEQAHEQEDINNRLERSTTSQLPFSVLQDKNPKGVEWLQGVVQRVSL